VEDLRLQYEPFFLQCRVPRAGCRFVFTRHPAPGTFFLSLPLLVFWNGADDPDHALPPDDLALAADSLH
jgi:hypothetical protein